MYDRVIWPEKYDPKCRPSVRSNHIDGKAAPHLTVPPALLATADKVIE